MPPANIVATNTSPYGTTGLVNILSNALQAATAFEQAISAVNTIAGTPRTGGAGQMAGGAGSNPLTSGIYYVAPGYQGGMAGGSSPYASPFSNMGGYNYGYPGGQASLYGAGSQYYSPYTAFPQVGGGGLGSRLPAVNYLGSYNNYGSLLQNYMNSNPVVNGQMGGNYMGMSPLVTGMPGMSSGMPGSGGIYYPGGQSLFTGMAMGPRPMAGVGQAAVGRSGAAGNNNNNNGRLSPFSNGNDGGQITSIGFGNPMIDAIMGTDYNGDIGGGNARRSTNNAVLQGGMLGASRFTNAQRTDFNGLSNLINNGADPLSESVFRTFRQEGGKNVYRAFVDGNPAAIAASRRADGTINGAELANQGNNTRGQAHWTKEFGRAVAGADGTEIVIHNAVKGESVALPGGGFRTFVVNDNGGDHNGKIAGYVDDRFATSAQNAKDRLTLTNQALSATDVGSDGGVVQSNSGASAANYGAGSARGSGNAAMGSSMAGMNH